MKRQTLKCLLLCGLAAHGWLPGASFANEPLPVVTTFSILADLVRQVGAEHVRVTSLVGADEDAHGFEPRPADARTLLGARLFVVNGLDFEPWAAKLARSAGFKGQTLVSSQGVTVRRLAGHAGHGHEEADPHAWQDPQQMAIYAQNIAQALGRLDPVNAAAYQKNAARYQEELQSLDRWMQQQLAGIAPAKRQVITSHDAFGYLGARYQIRFLAPQGLNADVEPSARQVAQLIRQIKRDQIRAVFVENMRNPKLLAQITQDTGITLGPKLYVDALSGPQGPAPSYLAMMRYNMTQLVAGMRLN